MISTTTKINTTRTGEMQRRSDTINNIFACVAFATGSAYKIMLAFHMDFRSQCNASKSEQFLPHHVIRQAHYFLEYSKEGVVAWARILQAFKWLACDEWLRTLLPVDVPRGRSSQAVHSFPVPDSSHAVCWGTRSQQYGGLLAAVLLGRIKYHVILLRPGKLHS